MKFDDKRLSVYVPFIENLLGTTDHSHALFIKFTKIHQIITSKKRLSKYSYDEKVKLERGIMSLKSRINRNETISEIYAQNNTLVRLQETINEDYSLPPSTNFEAREEVNKFELFFKKLETTKLDDSQSLLSELECLIGTKTYSVLQSLFTNSSSKSFVHNYSQTDVEKAEKVSKECQTSIEDAVDDVSILNTTNIDNLLEFTGTFGGGIVSSTIQEQNSKIEGTQNKQRNEIGDESSSAEESSEEQNIDPEPKLRRELDGLMTDLKNSFIANDVRAIQEEENLNSAKRKTKIPLRRTCRGLSQTSKTAESIAEKKQNSDVEFDSNSPDSSALNPDSSSKVNEDSEKCSEEIETSNNEKELPNLQEPAEFVNLPDSAKFKNINVKNCSVKLQKIDLNDVSIGRLFEEIDIQKDGERLVEKSPMKDSAITIDVSTKQNEDSKVQERVADNDLDLSCQVIVADDCIVDADNTGKNSSFKMNLEGSTQAPRTFSLVQNMSYFKSSSGDNFIRCEYEGCGYESSDDCIFRFHIQRHVFRKWSGLCQSCNKHVEFEIKCLDVELDHLVNFHIKGINPKPIEVQTKKRKGSRKSLNDLVKVRRLSNEIPRKSVKYQEKNSRKRCESEKLSDEKSRKSLNIPITDTSIIDIDEPSILENPTTVPTEAKEPEKSQNFIRVRALPGDILSGKQPQIQEPVTPVSLKISAVTGSNPVITTKNCVPALITHDAIVVNASDLQLRPWLRSQNPMPDRSSVTKWKNAVENVNQILFLLFKCMQPCCVFATNDSNQFVQHSRTHASKNLLGTIILAVTCPYCEFSSFDGAIVVNHIIANHMTQRFACSQCFYRSVNDTNVKIHHIRHHSKIANIKIFEIGGLQQYDGKSVMAEIRKEGYKFVDPMKCHECPTDIKFRCIDAFYSHFVTVHPKFEKCLSCNQNLKSMNGFKIHLRECYNIFEFSCIYCKYGASDSRDFVNHITDVHPQYELMFAERRNPKAMESNSNGKVQEIDELSIKSAKEILTLGAYNVQLFKVLDSKSIQ